ncbi:MAG: alginate export family protein [Myxococcota bacterium]
MVSLRISRSLFTCLGAAVVFVGFGPAQAQAGEGDVKAPLSLTPQGYFFTRFERYDGYQPKDVEAHDFVRYRGMLSLTTSPIAINDTYTFQTRISPQVSNFWGVGMDTSEDPTLFMHEAAMILNMPGSTLTAGRFEMQYGDDLVIGPSRWSYIGRAFDGVRLRMQKNADAPWVDLFITQPNEGFVADADNWNAGDAYFAGVYGNMGALVPGKPDLDLYALANFAPGISVDGAIPTDGLTRVTLGTRLKGKYGPGDFRVELGYQTGAKNVEGTDTAVTALQADAELGVNLPVGKGFRLALEGFYASGNDPDTSDVDESWDQLFPTTHRALGHMDYLNKRSNLYGSVFHAKLEPFSFLTIESMTHLYWSPYHKWADGTYTTDEYEGAESDLGLTYKIGKGLQLKTVGGFFWRPAAIYPAVDADKLRLAYLDLELQAKF